MWMVHKNTIVSLILIILSFPEFTALEYKKASLFDEFSTFKETSLSVSNELNKPLTSTFDLQTGHPIKHILVTFNYNGDEVVLDLKLNKGLFLSGYVEKVANMTTHPADVTRSSCYYVGHISRIGSVSMATESMVAASTCSGVRAFVVLPDDVLHIEPTSIAGRHLVFKESEALKKFKIYESGEETPEVERFDRRKKMERKRQRRQVQMPYDANNETLIVELYIVNDHSQFLSQGGDVDAVIDRTKEILNIVNSLFRSLNIYVALVGVEVWSDTDRIELMDTSDGTMNKFLEYRRRYINSVYPNDNAQMISGRSFGEEVVGKAPIMTMCSWQYSGGINLDRSQLVGRIATTMAHEMGHNFGMTHDTDISKCPDEKCIMSPSSGGTTNPTKWSENSKEQLSDAIAQGMHHCLHNIPTKLFGDRPVCGDGFVDKGEECDCGLPKDCTSKCCDATTCKFLPHAKCSSGNCCDLDTCQLRPETYECRATKGDCDLPEHCDGSSEFCPFDVFKHNGYRCIVGERESYCFNGQCRTHDTQCKLLWGRTGRSSHPLCYTQLNMEGEPTGNCGLNLIDGKIYKKCEIRDVMCGMLHCEHVSEKLMFWKEALSFHMPDTNIQFGDKIYGCKAAILDVGLDSDNPGLAPDGSKCGENMMCMLQKCLPIDEVMTQLKCPDCNGNGICNSLSQCHCNPGWGPPYCNKLGGGGSVHSNRVGSIRDNVGVTVVVGLFFGLILPCFLICLIYVYKRRSILYKKICLEKHSSKPVPTRPPPRPSSQPTPKTFNPSKRLQPPPFRPPSPPHKPIVAFSVNRRKDEDKYRVPPRLPPKSRVVTSYRPQGSALPYPRIDSLSLKEALSELQKIDFLAGDENQQVEPAAVFGEVRCGSESDVRDHEQEKLVPFRKAPPPPPPMDERRAPRRSVSLKPPERPPPPPKLRKV